LTSRDPESTVGAADGADLDLAGANARLNVLLARKTVFGVDPY